MHPTERRGWVDFARDQDGAFTRVQAAAFGITDSMIRAQLAAGRWQRVYEGVFVTHNGSIAFRTRVWAAVLHCGPGAVASHRAAAYLSGIIDQPPWSSMSVFPTEDGQLGLETSRFGDAAGR